MVISALCCRIQRVYKMKIIFAVFAAIIAAVSCDPTVYFKDDFSDADAWGKRWTKSAHSSDYGEFKLTSGKFYGDAEKDKGLQTSQDAKFYGISAKLDEDVKNEGKTFVVQFTVKHEQNIDCGGGYVKLFPSSLKQEDMHGESQYAIMFGPDICGPGTKKVHVIFNYKGKNLLIKKDIRCKDDVYTHLYTLILRPDNTYEVKIDNEKAESGSLEDDWEFLKPKKIKDPEAKKPEDWDDNEKIPDPEDKKPDDWEKPEHIADPDAKKPDDWDEEMDGDWEPPQIDNPDYKGEWKPKEIDNPNYKGKWIHPEIDNPEYEADDKLYYHESIAYLGLDLWQVKSGTIFDNFLVTDCEKHAEQVGKDTWGKTKDPERKMKDDQDEKERKQEEEAEKARKEAEGDKDDDEDKKDDDDEDKKDDDDDDNDEDDDKSTEDDDKAAEDGDDAEDDDGESEETAKRDEL